MNALFVTNQRKTAFYEAMARRMQALGAKIHWIGVSECCCRFLRDRGWAAADILPLHRFGPEWSGAFFPDDTDFARAARLEMTAEAGLHNILVMDRELSRRPGAEKQAYVHVVTREVERFVRAKAIGFGFGEATWAPEMLASEVLRANGGRYYEPHTIRVPSTRIAFFEGIFHDKLARLATPDGSHRALAKAAIANLRLRGARPYYFDRNNRPQRFRRHWLEEAWAALRHPADHRHDHGVPRLAIRVSRRIKARFLASHMRQCGGFEQPPDFSRQPFVFAMLHRQPEASLDVSGAPFDNQLETLRALARLLPFGWELWVKEHSHALGDRPLAFYRALRCLPGVRLIDPGADALALIRRARLVVAASGTGCLEAALLGVPAVTFGRLLWSPILLRSGFDPFGMTHLDMAQLLCEAERMRRDPDLDSQIESFMAWLIAQSIEGLVGDPVNDPLCLETGNVDRVARAALTLESPARRNTGGIGQRSVARSA